MKQDWKFQRGGKVQTKKKHSVRLKGRDGYFLEPYNSQSNNIGVKFFFYDNQMKTSLRLELT